MRANYTPVPRDYVGSMPPFLLNQGRKSVTDVEVLIGTRFRNVIPSIEPGARVSVIEGLGSEGIHLAADLLGGVADLSFARFDSSPPKEYRHAVEVRYSRGGRKQPPLQGVLWGNAKRCFYRFKPARGRATPIY